VEWAGSTPPTAAMPGDPELVEDRGQIVGLAVDADAVGDR
jgi:hypothetical protein